MHKIVNTSYGCRMTTWGKVCAQEVEQMKHDYLTALSSQDKPFSLIVDVREMIPADPDVLEAMGTVQSLCREMSLVRAAIVVSSPVLKVQAKRVSLAAGTVSADRVIDASKCDDWEGQALAWVEHGIEPASIMKVGETQ